MKTIAIIVAGGKGKRMGQPKQFLKIAGRPMLAWTLAAFQYADAVDGIILVVAKEDIVRARKQKFSKIIAVVPGGQERQDSVKNGLKSLPASAEIVIIHDGARPVVTAETINRSARAAEKYGAVVVGVPVVDTIKTVDSRRLTVDRTLNRRVLWQA